VVRSEDKNDYFEEFLRLTKMGARLVIYVLDSNAGDHNHEYWEYVCDNVIQLDSSYIHEYYLRSIEVVKTRYQGHILGKQLLKIYDKPVKIQGKPDVTDLQRKHPFINEGGIFIFPSIHFYLSLYKRRQPVSAEEYIAPYLPRHLRQTFQIPQGRCTAFIGPRGGHKSHLAYLFLLSQMIDKERHNVNGEEKALVISLRDDEAMTIHTMNKILDQEFADCKSCVTDVNELVKSGNFEVLYYRPGFITPEEFFHRMFLSIHRLKKGGANLTVVFNSLDQLPARFPLCVKQEIFIPGLIDTLSAEGVTSIFIAVEEKGQPIEQFGLLPMSDLIVSFDRRRFAYDQYMAHIQDSWGQKESKPILEDIRHRESIVLEVLRSSGGHSAGARGLLELIEDASTELYQSEGLHFTPMKATYDQGEIIQRDK
jgi:hypothetical protein